MRASILVLLLISFGSFGARADAPLPAQLSLAQALDAFRQRGFDLLIADAQAEAAAADVDAADAVANPAVSVSYGRSFYYRCRAGKCPTPPGALAIQLSDQAAITDVLSGKRHLRGEVARAALRAARLGRADAERSLRFQVKAQFLQLLLAQNVLRFAEDTAAASALMLDKTEKQRAADKIQRPDLLRVKVAKLEAEQAVDQARQAVRKARAALAFLLGARGEAPALVAAQPELERSSSKLGALDHDALLAQAYATRPDLAAQRELVAGADANVALNRRQRFPALALSIGYVQQGTDDNAVSPPTISLGLAAPLPLLYRQQGEIGRAVANARAQRLADDKLRASVRNDFEQAYADVVAAQALVRRMEDGALLESARQAKDDIQLLYEKGSAQLTDYLLALDTWIDTNIEYLDDVAGYWTAVFALELAIGKELP